MSKTTDHGENIANDIQGEDAYGYSGNLTLADIWNILDNIHSNFCEQWEQDKEESVNKVLHMLSNWMDELSTIDEDLPF